MKLKMRPLTDGRDDFTIETLKQGSHSHRQLRLARLLLKTSISLAEDFNHKVRCSADGNEYSGHFVRYFFIFRRCTIKELIINEQIRAQEVRLIGDDGEQIGIIPIEQAQQRAEEAHLDLVLMSPQAKPPVAKLMDYGKFRYDSIKKLKEQKKNQKTKETKEMRLSPRIEQHDLETKAGKVKGFLDGGDACKISVRFRGRELGHKDLGREVLDQFVELIGDSGVVDKKPTMEGRNMVMFLEPNPDKE